MMNLIELREHLDRLDNALVYILAERMSLIPKVAEFKKANNIPQYQPEREKEIIKLKREIAEKLGLNPDLVETLYKEIIKDAHRIEAKIIGE
jgi:chorismate mutase/prephenate dehydrogenase